MSRTSNQVSRRSNGRLRLGVQTPVWVLGPGVAALVLLALACGPNPRPPDPPRSLFERLGGMAPLQQWVDELAWRLAADGQLGDTFVRADLGQLKKNMLLMTCAITGGRCEYDLDRLAAAHEGLSLAGGDIDRFLEVAASAAAAIGLPKRPSAELIERLRTLRPRLGPDNRVGSER